MVNSSGQRLGVEPALSVESELFIEGITWAKVGGVEDIDAITETGNLNRTVGATNMNSESSRSHSILSIQVTFPPTEINGAGHERGKKAEGRKSKIALVDLAGSERASKTGAAGTRMKEGCNINKSLSTLGRCVAAMVKAQKKKSKDVIPFRESTLTWLLKDALFGNAKSTLMAALSPADVNYEETMATLPAIIQSYRLVLNLLIFSK